MAILQSPIGLLAGLLAICMLFQSAAAIHAQPAEATDDLSDREERAMQVAVSAVAPSVVRIETVGGLETVEGMLVGTGPTTGLVVSADGYIVSSAFNFAQKPSQILIFLPDGTRLPAKQISIDNSRKLVLLKVDPPSPLTPPQVAPQSEMAIGQWAIAVGRTFDNGTTPNVSVGILSAVNRIWGKALQTDAKISPSNYGGPLVDIRGRVMGVLVPLSNMGGPKASALAGADWYDSGIGFAIPIEHIMKMLPKMQKTEELHSGLMGISLKGDLYAGEAIIKAVLGGSPANRAGLKAEDKIVEVDDVPVRREAELKHQLEPHYAGDTIKIVALRGKVRIETNLELIDKLVPYQHPFLGLLPLRNEPESAEGVGIRYVFPDSPAQAQQFRAGDRITSFQGKPVKQLQGLLEQLANVAVDEEVQLELKRGTDDLKIKLKTTALPEAFPAALTALAAPAATEEKTKLPTGKVTIRIPEAPNNCVAYVPADYNPAVSYGLVVWLHPPGGVKEDELIDLWKDICSERKLILLIPKSTDAAKWQRTEMEVIRKAADDVIGQYNIDRTRVVLAGQEGGGSLAFLVAFANPELVRAVIAVDAALPARTSVPFNEPLQRMAFVLTEPAVSKQSKAIEETATQLRANKHPVIRQKLGLTAKALTKDEIQDLGRWIDSLDRL
ncbi:MAG: PDZ domain-containing protein [Planctomycetota bacterium]|nr:PDZ domain-containing protein [Planctomycetota bacterium]